ncbi:hypothetical protein Ahy_A07g036538 [Arachis hypogaea]|uniref:Uncharacterized protein n=1 Tax=Arachis hypogaea TaxID=3818 RepID=A0A445CGD8_ARAHY|nr:hypothetical protein Ahy_A07g036538 [Arachis hypogaea]
MDDSTSDCQLNQSEVDFEFELNEVPELVTKVGMTFKTLKDAAKFYKDYAKATGFSTRTNPTADLNCLAKIYIHTLKDVGAWIILKVVLHHSHPCYPTQAEMLKQHTELNMFIRCTIENNEEAGIRPSKTFQSFVAAAGGHRELNFIENNVRNYITREVRNIPSKLNGYKGHAEIEQEMSQVVWNSHNNKWLSGIRSTQRSESMHLFFNKFITRNSSLIQFVKQYDNYLGSKEQAERESDAADFHTVIPCATKSSIEAQKVQAQFRGKANYITRLTNFAISYSIYEVGEQVFSLIFNKFVVTCDSVAAEVKCQCLLFESRGILCRQALSVLGFERPRSKRFDELVFRSQNICEFASESEELTAILHPAYDNVMVEMEELKAKRKGTCPLSHEDANLESVNELQSPPRVRTRGHPKNRLGSKLDKQIANASKKKKTKALNELNLFDAASVVRPNSSQYQGCVINYQFRQPAAMDNFLGFRALGV